MHQASLPLYGRVDGREMREEGGYFIYFEISQQEEEREVNLILEFMRSVKRRITRWMRARASTACMARASIEAVSRRSEYTCVV